MKSILYRLFIGLLLLALFPLGVSAQKGIDTMAIKQRIANEYVMRDSMLQAQKQRLYLDSLQRELLKKQQKQLRDSLANARQAQKTADSLQRIQAKLALIQAQKSRDSLLQARLKNQQDSLKQAKRTRDSLADAQLKAREQQSKLAQQRRDSIAKARVDQAALAKKQREALKKSREDLARYKNSKRYKDSVAEVRQLRKDSISNIREQQKQVLVQTRNRINDSIRSDRQRTNDSIAEARKRFNDSTRNAIQAQNLALKEARDKIKDSLMAIRKRRTDSLDLVKKNNPKPSNAGKSLEEQQRAAAMALHKKKQAEWTNEKFLKKRWNMPRRIFQNTVTRYNYYYNARRKYNEAIKTMAKSNKEDFEKPIGIYPYQLEKQGNGAGAAMDTVIKKSSFGTQIHDPRSKWFDNMYFLMGKASYTKGDVDGALMAFQFVANEYRDQGKKSAKGKQAPTPSVKKEKTDSLSAPGSKEVNLSIATPENRKGLKRLRHHPVRNDALVWLAKTYIRAEQQGEAQALLTLLEKDKQFPKRIKPELYATQVQLALSKNDPEEAIVALKKRLKTHLPEKERFRSEFLLAQLLADAGDYTASTEHFRKALSNKMDPEMAFFTKLNLAKQTALGGGERAYAIQQLNQIINDPKYLKYKSQALNTLAGLEAESNTDKALATLKKSIENPENKNPLQKAIAYRFMGTIYYTRGVYTESKMAYDSAVYYGTNPPMDSLAEITSRKNVLSDVVANLKVIRTQDSLLTLASKSDKEQRAAAKREMDRLKKEKTDQQISPAVAGVALQPNAQPGAVKSNWYFYNTANLEKGISEFKQKWGNRPLQDNWRRRAAMNLNANGQGLSGSDKDSSGQEVDALSLNLLLSKLPKSPAEQQLANKKIMDAWYDLGLAYYSRLSNYPAAIHAFDTLQRRYPNNPYKAPSFYGLYLSYEKLNKPDSSKYYIQLLQSDFPGTEYALRAGNPNLVKEEAEIAKLQQLRYDSIYTDYREGRYDTAKVRAEKLRNTLDKKNPLVVKCDMVEAGSLVGLKLYAQARTKLEKIINQFPDSPEQTWAQALFNKLEAIKNDSISGGPVAGATVLGDTLAGKQIPNQQGSIGFEQDSLIASPAFKELRDVDGKGIYIADADAEHKVVIFVKSVDGRTMNLKSAMSDYNLTKHNTKDYVTGMNMFTAKQAVVSVDRFSNAVFARQYKTEMEKEKSLFASFKSTEYVVMIISKANFAELIKTRDILGYMRFYKKTY